MNVDIAKNLADRRRAAGLSQEGLAEKLGVSRQAVSKWERSESSPDTDNLIALAKLYGVSLDELLYGEVEKNAGVTADSSTGGEERADTGAGVCAGAGAFSGTRSPAGAAPGCTSAYTDATSAPVETFAYAGTPSGAGSAAAASAHAAGSAAAAGAPASDGTSASGCSPSNPSNPFDAPDTADAADAPDTADTANSSNSHVSRKPDKIHVGFDGVHVEDGRDYVHVSWREGVHVIDGHKGDEVHVGWDGVHVNDKSYDYRNPHWREDANRELGVDAGSCGEGGRAFLHAWNRFPFPLVVVIVYIVLGVTYGSWAMALFLAFTVPLYYLVGRLIATRRVDRFIMSAYPIGVVAWFCYMAFVLNEAHPAWVVFLTIPVVECLTGSVARSCRRRKRARRAVCDVIEAEGTQEQQGES